MVHHAQHSERGVAEGQLEDGDKEKIKAAVRKTLDVTPLPLGWKLLAANKADEYLLLQKQLNLPAGLKKSVKQ